MSSAETENSLYNGTASSNATALMLSTRTRPKSSINATRGNGTRAVYRERQACGQMERDDEMMR